MTVNAPLEAHTRTQINMRLRNLGWVLDQHDPHCNVFQEQPKTDLQKRLLGGYRPDYVLYDTGTDTPLAIIEAKRPGEDLDSALDLAAKRYARPLQVPLVFAFNDTFVTAKHLLQNQPLKIDGEELKDFVDHLTALRFINEGAELLSTPQGVDFSREALTAIFKRVSNLLRKEGLRDGYERFSAFSEILFLKFTDEFRRLNQDQIQGFEDRYYWSGFTQRYQKDMRALRDFVADSVWPRIHTTYPGVFAQTFSIQRPDTLREIIKEVDVINLTATDTDIKGDAFEFFLKTVTNGNKDLGEYFTPRHIVRTMVNLVKPLHGETIYDPFCGTGGFLLECFKYLMARTDPRNQDMVDWIKKDALHGRELTSTSRIAKMNMLLFGDGHTNIEQKDSLEHPEDESYEIVLSNIPYSQKTEFGDRYPIPTNNADSVCIQHIWRSLQPGGRAAVIVPESFLYEGGDIGRTRSMILKDAERITVVSLPRGVFMPYTPTKTNILYWKKGKSFRNAFFFVVHNDGFELNTGRSSIGGTSDIKDLLSEVEEPRHIPAQANVVSRVDIEKSENWNLRPFYYMEDVPNIQGELASLSEGMVEERIGRVDPREYPDQTWSIIEVSQNGIFLGDVITGSEAKQTYKQVCAGDIVYNPYRVNIGSIGVVPTFLDGGLASPAYVVFRSISQDYPPSYITSILKHPRYLRVIMNYSLSSARANLPFSELSRIKIPKPRAEDMVSLRTSDAQWHYHVTETTRTLRELHGYVNNRMKRVSS